MKFVIPIVSSLCLLVPQAFASAIETVSKPQDVSSNGIALTTYPVVGPSDIYVCSTYSASDTNYAQQNYVSCFFTACGGTDVLISGCDNGDCSNSNDQYLVLYDSSSQVASDDDGCGGRCSFITYSVPGDSSTCSDFDLHQGCWSTTSCTGTMEVRGSLYVYPTEVPTEAPTVVPTLSIPPSEVPSVTPSAAPSVSSAPTNPTITCVPYNATDTNYATQNYAECLFIACGGVEVVVSDCSCTGDQYLSIYDSNGAMVTSDDDGCGSGCSYATFTPTGNSSDCSVYSIHEGCFDYVTCSGTVSVSGDVSVAPTPEPTEAPSAVPTLTFAPSQVPSEAPTASPTSSLTCASYSATDTVYATQNYAVCTFIACGNSMFTVSGCNACSSDQMIIVYDADGVSYTSDDACGACSQVSIWPNQNSSACQEYSIHEGCYAGGTCSGTITVTGDVMGVPSVRPSRTPTVRPSRSQTPSVRPTSVAPTIAPSAAPTVVMTSVTCPFYRANDTNFAQQNYANCSFTVCGGSSVTVSGGCDCNGDIYLRTYSSGSEVAYDDDDCGLCSSMTFVPSTFGVSCIDYTVHEGCFDNGNCSGTVTVSSDGSLSLVSPAPSPAPTVSVAPTTVFDCPVYSATQTYSASTGYTSCSFTACGGTTVEVSGCGMCSGDQYLVLVDDSGNSLTYNDDYCTGCSYFTYTVPGEQSECSEYTVREGCWSSSSCSGTVRVSGTSSFIGAPSAVPTHVPTARPTTRVPTVVPSEEPTRKPVPDNKISPEYGIVIPVVLGVFGLGTSLLIYYFFVARAAATKAGVYVTSAFEGGGVEMT